MGNITKKQSNEPQDDGTDQCAKHSIIHLEANQIEEPSQDEGYNRGENGNKQFTVHFISPILFLGIIRIY